VPVQGTTVPEEETMSDLFSSQPNLNQQNQVFDFGEFEVPSEFRLDL